MRLLRYVCLLTITTLAVPSVAAAQQQGQQQNSGANTSESGDSPFTGWGFGSGIIFLAKGTGPDRVSQASIDVNGIVHVDTRNNTSTGLALEIHHFFYSHKNSSDHPTWGMGPFVGLQAGTSNIINAVGVGWMVGWKALPGNTDSHAAFNLGVGYAGIPTVQSLGDEFKDGQKAPVDKDGKPLPIRYFTHDSGAFMFMASFTF
jgi:hypothetical protein